MTMIRFEYILLVGGVNVLLLGWSGCGARSESLDTGGEVGGPDVTLGLPDIPLVPSSDVVDVSPNDNGPADAIDASLDAIFVEDVVVEDGYTIPDCAVLVHPEEEPELPDFPVQPPSSRQSCLCYPNGEFCTYYFHESCYWDSAPFVEDENSRCPIGEICTGDILQGFVPNMGVCVRPCYHPDAAVTAEFNCASTEECIAVPGLAAAGSDLPCMTDDKPSKCLPPEGFRTCKDAVDASYVAMCVPKERKQPDWDFSGCPPEDRPKIFLPDVTP